MKHIRLNQILLASMFGIVFMVVCGCSKQESLERDSQNAFRESIEENLLSSDAKTALPPSKENQSAMEESSSLSSFAEESVQIESVPVAFQCLFCPNEEVKNYLSGNIIDYSVLIDGNEAYELMVSDTLIPDTAEVYATLFVSERQSNGSYLLRKTLPIPRRIAPDFTGGACGVQGGLFLADADFDGQKDILIHQGLFGTQAYSSYCCFLKRESGYEEESSFSDILNPYIDEKERVVYSTWRNWTASHSWARYEYKDGAFRQIRVLTEEWVPREDDETAYQYSYSVIMNGKLIEKEKFSSTDWSDDEIVEKLDSFGCGFGRISQSYAVTPIYTPLK